MKTYKHLQKLAVAAVLITLISACSTTVQPMPQPTAVIATTPIVATTSTPAVIVSSR